MSDSPYKVTVNLHLHQRKLEKDTWLVILHAARTPPHIGVMIDGNYNSLTIKGHELNVSITVLLKTIQLKKIETLFIPLKKHPVFSLNFQLDILQLYVNQFLQVKNTVTCLSPVKLFLQEFYALALNEKELLFELVERLKRNDYIEPAMALNIEGKLTSENEFVLPIYSPEELQSVIKTEREKYYST